MTIIQCLCVSNSIGVNLHHYLAYTLFNVLRVSNSIGVNLHPIRDYHFCAASDGFKLHRSKFTRS